jgi:diadenylate cyclase
VETLIEYFRRVATYNGWQVAIELISIGFVVYWAVDFLEGTRGEKLFRGVIFILIAGMLILNLVVERFGFERLQYLYKGFLIAVLIIAVAAFQPEIRRALIRIGQPGFLTGRTQQLVRTAEEIISAVIDLSATKTGSVIVIEKDVALGEFIDMAVVIRGDRIVAARVQLPLIEDGTRNGIQLGSRHRAALGITAGSDASVIVVSEETGIVSIAQNEKLSRNITESELRKHLADTMDQAEPAGERFWKFHRKKSIAQK